MSNKIKSISMCGILLVGSSLALMSTGCTAAGVNSVVSKITAYVPTAIALVQEALTIYTAIAGADESVTSALTTIQADLSQLKTLCADYTAATSSSAKTTAWSNIEALIDTLTVDADNILTIASVKNSDSKAAGVIVITSLDAAIHILDAYVSSTQTTAEVNAKLSKRTIKLRTLVGKWSNSDKQMVASAFGVDFNTAYQYAIARGY